MRAFAGFLGVILLAAIVAGAHRRMDSPYLPNMDFYGVSVPANPYISIAQTARHLAEAGSFHQPVFGEVRETLRKTSAEHPGILLRADLYAVARDGALWPKHCVLASLCAVPFYALFGNAGFWLLNQLLIFGLLFSAYHLAGLLAGPRAALYACMILAVLSNLFWWYSYTFSYDVMGAACLLGGLALLPRLPAVAGVLWAAAVAVRAVHLLPLPFLYAVGLSLHQLPFRPTTARCAAGFLLGWIPLLLYHTLVFGAPLAGPYAGVEYFMDGRAHSDLSSHYFSWRCLAGDWRARLFSPQDGLFIAGSIWIFVLALPFLRPRRHAAAFWGLMAVACSFTVLMLCFSYWHGSGGDRFVLFATALMSLPAAVLMEKVLARSPQPVKGPSGPGA